MPPARAEDVCEVDTNSSTLENQVLQADEKIKNVSDDVIANFTKEELVELEQLANGLATIFLAYQEKSEKEKDLPDLIANIFSYFYKNIVVITKYWRLLEERIEQQLLQGKIDDQFAENLRSIFHKTKDVIDVNGANGNKSNDETTYLANLWGKSEDGPAREIWRYAYMKVLENLVKHSGTNNPFFSRSFLPILALEQSLLVDKSSRTLTFTKDLGKAIGIALTSDDNNFWFYLLRAKIGGEVARAFFKTIYHKVDLNDPKYLCYKVTYELIVGVVEYRFLNMYNICDIGGLIIEVLLKEGSSKEGVAITESVLSFFKDKNIPLDKDKLGVEDETSVGLDKRTFVSSSYLAAKFNAYCRQQKRLAGKMAQQVIPSNIRTKGDYRCTSQLNDDGSSCVICDDQIMAMRAVDSEFDIKNILKPVSRAVPAEAEVHNYEHDDAEKYAALTTARRQEHYFGILRALIHHVINVGIVMLSEVRSFYEDFHGEWRPEKSRGTSRLSARAQVGAQVPFLKWYRFFSYEALIGDKVLAIVASGENERAGYIDLQHKYYLKSGGNKLGSGYLNALTLSGMEPESVVESGAPGTSASAGANTVMLTLQSHVREGMIRVEEIRSSDPTTCMVVGKLPILAPQGEAQVTLTNCRPNVQHALYTKYTVGNVTIGQYLDGMIWFKYSDADSKKVPLCSPRAAEETFGEVIGGVYVGDPPVLSNLASSTPALTPPPQAMLGVSVSMPPLIPPSSQSILGVSVPILKLTPSLFSVTRMSI